MSVIYSKAKKPARASVTVRECRMHNAQCTMRGAAKKDAREKKEKKDEK